MADDSPQLIATDSALADLACELAQAPVLAVDTEFMRVRTYFPVLCLVQIFDGERAVCVDALAISDLAPLLEVFETSPQPTLLHAARQDFETFYVSSQQLPRAVFDTQIAAAMTGPGDQLSYAKLVQDITGVELPKTQTRTNWARRPLTSQQLHYAADDVRYLPPLMTHYADALDGLGRREWFDAECERLLAHDLYEPDIDGAWRRCKSRRRFSPPQSGAWRQLCALRERTACAHDKPRRWIIEDAALEELATLRPDDHDGIRRVLQNAKAHRGLSIEAIAKVIGDAAPIEDERPQRLSPQELATMDKVLRALRRIAAELDIAPSVLATRRDAEQLVRGQRDIPLLSGWRRDVIGSRLLDIATAPS